MSGTWEMEDTVVLLTPEMRKPTLARGSNGFPIIIEPRGDHVLVVCGAYGGKGKTVAEAMDALARRLPR